MRLSFLQYAALTLFAPLAMIACDVPIPSGGVATTAEPVWTAEAVTLDGELTDADETRASGQKEDRVATVRVAPGHTLQVLMEDTDGAFDTYLTLYVENSDQTFTNDDFNGVRTRSYVSQLNPTESTMSVSIGASAYAESGRGSYTVRYQIVAPPEVPEGQVVSLPASFSAGLSGSTPTVPLTSNDSSRPADVYEFTLADGQTATIRMESTAFDTYLKVLRNGVFSARNDDFQGNRSVSQLRVSGPGVFTVFAGSFSASGAGAYTLALSLDGIDTPVARIESSPEATGGAEREVEGALTDSDAAVPLPLSDELRPADAYAIELRAGQTLIVEMESPNFDTYLRLNRGDGAVARNDDAGSTRRSAFRYTADADGTYTLLAGSFTSSGRGAYTLSWQIE